MGTQQGQAFNAAIGAQLRAEIAAAGLSVAAAARESGIPRGTLIRYLDGDRDIPVSVTYKIGLVVNLPADVIVERAYERFRHATEGGRDAVVLALPSRIETSLAVSDDADSLLAAHEDDDLVAELESHEEQP